MQLLPSLSVAVLECSSFQESDELRAFLNGRVLGTKTMRVEYASQPIIPSLQQTRPAKPVVPETMPDYMAASAYGGMMPGYAPSGPMGAPPGYVRAGGNPYYSASFGEAPYRPFVPQSYGMVPYGSGFGGGYPVGGETASNPPTMGGGMGMPSQPMYSAGQPQLQQHGSASGMAYMSASAPAFYPTGYPPYTQ